MDPTVKHIWQKLLHPAVVLVVVGCIAFVVAISYFRGPNDGGGNITPTSGPEGTKVEISVPSNVSLPSPVTVTFHDDGEHGYIAVKSGGGAYVTYDPTSGLSYKAEGSSTGGKITAEVPAGICGLIIKSEQEPNPQPKIVTVTLSGPDGQPIPGVAPASFAVKCDTYTLSIKTKASKDPVLPDGADQSIVTATLSVRGPAQFINGDRVKPSAPKIMIETPLGLVMVHFTADLGILAPNPANVKTALDGTANVTITSQDAGIANVRAIAQGIGDAIQKVHFPPKITAVKMDFVQPNSPTNYQLQTIPANAGKLDFDWSIALAPPPCGNMTGAKSGKGLTKNGYFHGPAGGRKEGCPEETEMASKVTVTVTDKDGQTDTKTFGARAFEGQGFAPLK